MTFIMKIFYFFLCKWSFHGLDSRWFGVSQFMNWTKWGLIWFWFLGYSWPIGQSLKFWPFWSNSVICKWMLNWLLCVSLFTYIPGNSSTHEGKERNTVTAKMWFMVHADWKLCRSLFRVKLCKGLLWQFYEPYICVSYPATFLCLFSLLAQAQPSWSNEGGLFL